MHWRPFIAVFLISLACGSRLAAQSSTPAETAGSKPAITNIRIVSESQALTIEVSTNSPAIPDTERLENPDRIVFDFPGFVMQSPAQHLNVNHDIFKKDTVFIRSGGSIPIVTDFQDVLKIPSVMMGFGLPDDNLHAPNEKFHIPNFHRGIESICLFFERLGN